MIFIWSRNGDPVLVVVVFLWVVVLVVVLVVLMVMVFVMEVVVVVVFYCGDGLFTVCLVLVVGGDVDDRVGGGFCVCASYITGHICSSGECGFDSISSLRIDTTINTTITNLTIINSISTTLSPSTATPQSKPTSTSTPHNKHYYHNH